ncbi:MAG: class I SAM-dependent rRNA methyltransferase [Cytophagales bacterium]|nr:class I SAM-dependent rRNA methyltransferase [Cytophagales bacterium]MDW8383266.1 class I SAM-dependent rRNA methyltransferase [Flammeovirgaceae bacterium]
MKKLLLKKGKERALYNRHPWIFSGAVKDLPNSENGEIVQIFDYQQQLLGYGFFSPKNQIVCRVFEFTSYPITIDKQYWFHKIQRAFGLRKQLIDFQTTNCFRLLHAEGDFFPGVIADVYNQTVVLQILIRGTELILESIVEALLKLGFQYIYLKTKDVSHSIEKIQTDSGWIGNIGTTIIEVKENNIVFKVDIAEGQKTGFFLDQRDARRLVKEYAFGKTVLNAFSYTGGFSAYALCGGAVLVHSVDSSKAAIQLAKENMLLNGFSAHEAFCEDVFDFLKQTHHQYDMIILDPPAFAKTAKAVSNAARGYKELNLKAFQKIKSGGIVATFSCSQKIDKELFRKIVFAAAADARRNVRILHQTTQPPDHPINIFHPENEYLKGLFLYVE